jgi:sulfite dehydrogenase (cytochrome) subunit B
MVMRHRILTTLAIVTGLGFATVHAAPVVFTLPDETAAFKPGANLEVVQNNCTACHSADYVKTQPRGEKFKKDFWAAEVTKMIKVYGAPIEDADVGKIVDYLTANY